MVGGGNPAGVAVDPAKPSGVKGFGSRPPHKPRFPSTHSFEVSATENPPWLKGFNDFISSKRAVWHRRA